MKIWKNKDLIKSAWAKTKENFWPLVAFVAVVYLAGSLGRMLNVGFVVDILTSFVLTSVFLRIARGEKFDFKNIFRAITPAKFIHYILATIIVMVLVIAGIALFIVPGIIIGIMLSFVTYVLVDEDNKFEIKSVSFWTAIKKSYFMTKGHKWRIFLLVLVLAGLNILGFIAFVVGLLVTVPVSGITLGMLYEKLKNKEQEPVDSNMSLPESSEKVG